MSIKIPFLKDNHNHLFTYSSIFEKQIDLFNYSNKNNIKQLLQNLSSNSINIATGWLDNYYTFSKEELNSFPPLILIHNSLHKFDFNNSAEKHIVERFPEFVKNKNSQQWIEKNLMKILSFIASLNKFDENSFKNILASLSKNGVSYAADMFVDNIEIFNFLEKTEYKKFTEIWTEVDFYEKLNTNHKNICEGIKIFMDGALGAKSAAISEAKSEWNPILIYSDAEIHNKIEKILMLKKAIAIHCIGDIAIQQIINCLIDLKQSISDTKIRLEHVQFITKEQAFSAKDLGLILSMQPNFNMDSIIYQDRLTKKYCENNNPFRMLINDAGFIPGKDLIFGSDGMPSGVHNAIQTSLFPPIENQKITLEEFVEAYCIENYEKYIEVEISNNKKKTKCKIVEK